MHNGQDEDRPKFWQSAESRQGARAMYNKKCNTIASLQQAQLRAELWNSQRNNK